MRHRFVLYSGSLRASERLYRILLHSILRAPLRFFDTQALGRLLNRFGKDFEGVDAALPDHFGRSLMYGLGVFTTLAVIATVSPFFLVFFAFLSIAYFHYARLFSKTARELRRLDSVSKSPLYSICEFLSSHRMSFITDATVQMERRLQESQSSVHSVPASVS